MGEENSKVKIEKTRVCVRLGEIGCSIMNRRNSINLSADSWPDEGASRPLVWQAASQSIALEELHAGRVPCEAGLSAWSFSDGLEQPDAEDDLFFVYSRVRRRQRSCTRRWRLPRTTRPARAKSLGASASRWPLSPSTTRSPAHPTPRGGEGGGMDGRW